jgi:hypothetical protein
MRLATVTLGFACLFFGSIDAAAQNVTLTGTVTDAATLAPLHAGVAVYLYDARGQLLGFVSPDATGRYEFHSYQGTFFVRAAAPGHVSELHSNIPCIAADCAFSSGSPVVLPTGATVTVDFAPVCRWGR